MTAGFAPQAEPVRRLLDATIAAVALVVVAPLFLLCGALVVLTSPGPALFRQQRVGYGGRVFTMYKFRTMARGCDDTPHRAYVTRMLTEHRAPTGGDPYLYKLAADPRVTAAGRFLRRSSLDELPQLLNVVKGDMALVGPRPALPYEAELFEARHQVRFAVRPGITGLWQVSGRGRLTMGEALDLDVDYVRRRSLALDLRIIAKTIPALLRSHTTS